MSNSKKHKSNSAKANPQRLATPPAGNRSWLVWASLVVVGLLAIVAGLAGQASRSAAPDTASGGGAPNLQIDQTSIDFGDVPVNQMVKASFKLSNAGDGALTISHPPVPEVVEGC